MLIFRPEAEADVQSAYDWYESQRTGLGEAFLLSLDATIAGIQRLPNHHPTVYRDLHRALLQRFPYAVFYLIDSGRIVVTAVMHQRQDPQRWQGRN
jgi:plasmid stabilization system protein ParE